MTEYKLKIQRFRTNDLIDNGGKQFELGKGWCEDFFGINSDVKDTTLFITFKPLSIAHRKLDGTKIELQLSEVNMRGDRKAYANSDKAGCSQIKDFFINKLHLTVENNLKDYFAFYKLDTDSYLLYYVPELLYNNFLLLFKDEIPPMSVDSKSDKSDVDYSTLQQIFYGAPGTGKSHTVKKDTVEWEKKGRVVRTTFHPDSDYSTFVGAYKPTTESVQRYDIYNKPMTRDGKPVMQQIITYKFVEQAFLQAYIDAWENREEPEFLIIEEINRGNCAQIFGDLFQLLDRGADGYSEYAIRADKDLQKHLSEAFEDVEIEDYPNVKSGKELLLPSNLYIWATMNTSDQSLFPIDSAFKRRWDWKYMPINNAGKNWVIEVNGAKYDWWDFLSAINEKIYGATYSEDKKLGYFFCKADCDVISADKFVSKVIFYLWNDVFKDSEFEGDAFKDDNGEKLSFDKFYSVVDNKAKVNEEKVELFLKNLNLHPITTAEANDDEEYFGQKESSDENMKSDWGETEKKRYEYWDAFLKYAPEQSEDFAKYFGGIKKASKDHWKNFFISGMKDFYLVAIQQRRKNAIEMQVYFESTTDLYHKLFAHKNEIEQELGIQYSWREMPEKKSSIISEEKKNVDLEDKENWHEQFDFIIDRLLRMRETFLKYSQYTE